MTGPTRDTNLNLGRYSIRTPEVPSDLRVGSFWKRKQSANLTDDSNRELIYSIPKSKKLATAASDVISTRKNSNPRGSFTSRSTSCDTDSAFATSQLIIDQAPIMCTNFTDNNRPHTIGQSVNDRATNQSCESFLKEPLSLNKSSTLVIDTQCLLSCEQTKDSENTHESLVIELAPMELQSFDDETTITSIRSSEELDNYSLRTPDGPRVQMRLKTYPKQLSYNKILTGVIFIMSGFENPRRAKLRDLAVEMGAKYRPKWNRFCTHLICAFKHTPKYREVAAENGRIVREHWIQECSKQRQLLDWRNFKLGKYPYPDSEEEVDLD